MSGDAAIRMVMGKSHEGVVRTLVSYISHDLKNVGSFTIASNTSQPTEPPLAIAHQLASRLHRRRPDPLNAGPTRIVTVAQPDNTGARLTALLDLARRYKPVTLTSPGATFASVKVRRDIVDAPGLLAVSSIGSLDAIGPLAFGLWTSYIDPRLAFVLSHPARRDPALADVASGVSPTLLGTVLTGYFKGYVVMVWSSDLVAAELAGLAVWTATLPGSVERFGPWEDPIVQRATELDLGVQSPSGLSFQSAWAADTTDTSGLETIGSLTSTVAPLLNIPTSSTAEIRSGPRQ